MYILVVQLCPLLTAFLHSGHKAGKRDLWSQLHHRRRRRSYRHWSSTKQQRGRECKRQKHRGEKALYKRDSWIMQMQSGALKTLNQSSTVSLISALTRLIVLCLIIICLISSEERDWCVAEKLCSQVHHIWAFIYYRYYTQSDKILWTQRPM